MDPVGLRLQGLDLGDQVVCLARLAQSRSETGLFAPADIDTILDDVGLPRPVKTSNVLGRLEKAKPALLTRVKGARGAAWKLTPEGKARALTLMSDMDAAALHTEMEASSATILGNTAHPVVPAHFSPPDLLGPLREFLEAHPFDNNVFGMTRFPEETDDDTEDPVAPALRIAREVCGTHGLEFHLASDRQIVDDLWGNVTAHMWASRYGIAIFENRADKGLNYNLTIEVGGMLVLGRRTALLKDKSIKSMPTDLVGKIYKSVDLDRTSTIKTALEAWIRDDLGR